MKLLLLIAAAVVGNTAGAHVRIPTSFLDEQSHIQCNEPSDQSKGCPEDRIPYLCPEAADETRPNGVLLCCMWDHLPEQRKQKANIMKDVNLDDMESVSLVLIGVVVGLVQLMIHTRMNVLMV